MIFARLLVLGWLIAASAFAQSVVISQIYGGGGNAGAALRNDYIELFNRGAAPVSLTGWSVQYASATGADWQVTPLTGVIAPGGYYLIQQAAGAAGTTALPIPDAMGMIAMSATAAKVALVNATAPLSGASPAGGIADLVGYGDTATGFESSPVRQLSNTTAALRRNGGCIDTDNNAADFETGPPDPRNSQTVARSCDLVPVAARLLAISAIQGSGDLSPVAGSRVVARGIVTGRKSNGIFIQSPDADADSDPQTSEGLFVFTSSRPPDATVKGALVEVTGTVTEFRPASDIGSPTLTELVDPQIGVLSTSNPLPRAIFLGDFQGNREQLEGMLVAAPPLTVVGPTGGSLNEATGAASSNGVFYAVLPDTPRPFREPGLRAPEAQLTVRPTNNVVFDENPERIRVDSRAQSGPAIDVTAGAIVRNVQGPLDFAFRTYTIAQDAEVQPEIRALIAASPIIPPEAREISVASMNLQRLFDDRDDPGVADVVVAAEVLQRRIARITRVVTEVLHSPDVIAVQEVENVETLRRVATSLGNYTAYLEEGNDPGGIDVGFLVKTPRIRVVSVTQEGKAARFTLPNGSTDELHDRPPLRLELEVAGTLTPFTMTVIVNHLRSLLPGGEAKRQAQAQYLRELAQRLLQERPDRNLLLLGDFNAFQVDDSILDVLATVKAAGLVNLTELLPMDQNYSYVFDGSTQTLDHLLVSGALRQRWSRFQFARVNADHPEVFRNDVARVERISDHDIPVAYFRLATETVYMTAAGVTNSASLLTGAIAPGEIVTIFGAGIGPAQGATAHLTEDRLAIRNELAGVRVFFDGFPAPIIYARADQVSAIVPYQVAGRSTTIVRLEYNNQTTANVLLPVVASSPAIFSIGQNGQGQGAILNQDFSVNGGERPADRGSVVMIYATGGGAIEPAIPTENLSRGLSRLTRRVKVYIGGIEAQVLYAGGAPGLASGVVQINARVPQGAPVSVAVPVVWSIDGRASQPGVTLSVR